MGGKLLMPCVTPNALLWSTQRGRPLSGVEKLMFQDFPVGKLKLSHLTEKVTWLTLESCCMLSCCNLIDFSEVNRLRNCIVSVATHLVCEKKMKHCTLNPIILLSLRQWTSHVLQPVTWQRFHVPMWPDSLLQQNRRLEEGGKKREKLGAAVAAARDRNLDAAFIAWTGILVFHGCSLHLNSAVHTKHQWTSTATEHWDLAVKLC